MLIFLNLPLALLAQFDYTNIDGTIIITQYTGEGGAVTIPDTIDGLPVTSIGESAFEGSDVTTIAMPNSITDIGMFAFANSDLESITLSTNLINIEGFAFSDCNALGTVVIPDSVLSLGESSFSPCGSLTNLIIGCGVTNIGDDAFSDSLALTNIAIPNGVRFIGAGAFFSCLSVTSLSLGTNISVIGDEAFGVCRFSSVEIPASVTQIGLAPFLDCSSLTTIEVDSNNPVYASECGALYNSNLTSLIEVPGAVSGSYIVRSTVTNISPLVFDSDDLTSVTIPSNVISLINCGFPSCHSLTNIIVDANNPYYSTLGGVLFDKHQSILVAYPGGMPFGPFFSHSYSIPDSVKNIGDYAFSEIFSFGSIGTNSADLVIPNSVTNIGNGAFSSTDFTNVTLGDSIQCIGSNAFYNCSQLSNITIPDGVSSLGSGAFMYCWDLKNAVLPNSLTNIASDLFLGCNLLTNVNIPTDCVCIGDLAFAFTSLSTVTIPGSVTRIEEYAFLDCGDLTCINIKEGVKDIGEEAFGSTALTSITIPASVTNIDCFVFAGCSNLSAVYFEGNSPHAGLGIFSSDNTIAYYLPWTSGWRTYFRGIPAMPGSRELQAGGASVQTNSFGFTLVWTNNPIVVVQACTNLSNPVWLPVATNTLAAGVSTFRDAEWANFSARYYRLSTP